MKNHVILKDGATAVISRVKPQPIIENGVMKFVRPDKIEVTGSLHSMVTYILDFAPYRIGQKVAVKEAWAEKLVLSGGGKYNTSYAYRSDYSKDTRYGWRSPVTQPLEAVRKWAIVESVECVRVRGLTWEQVKSMCYASPYTFELHIISKHGKTAWEQNEYIFLTSFKIEGK